MNVAFMGCSDFEKVKRILVTAKSMLGEVLSAFEFMDSVSMEIVEKHLRHRNPISAHPFYVLVETSGSHEPHDKEVGGCVRWACKVGV